MNIFFLILAALILGVFLFFKMAPQIGRKPSGLRLEQILKSPNYKQNVFQNPILTKMEAPPFEAFKIMLKKDSSRTPADSLETIPINTERYHSAKPDEVLVTWLGHSTVLVKMNGVTMITDPVFSKHASLFQFAGPKKFNYSHEFKLSELPPIDLVLLSHDHYDHLDYKVIKTLKDSVNRFIAPLGVGSHLERWGVDTSKIVELDWWEHVNYKEITITATPGRHFTGRLFNDRFKTLWCGWAIQGGNERIYFSGDSGYFDDFKEIGEKLGPFDLSIMECGQYSKYWPTIHMAPEESVQAAIDLRSKQAMPIHWGKFKLSIHPWNEPPARFAQKANEENFKVGTPKIGEVFTLNKLPQDEWWRF